MMLDISVYLPVSISREFVKQAQVLFGLICWGSSLQVARILLNPAWYAWIRDFDIARLHHAAPEKCHWRWVWIIVLSLSLSLCQWFKVIPMLGFISDLRLSQVEFFPTSNFWFPALLLRWLSQPSSLRADSGARPWLPWLPWLPWRGEGRLSLPRPRSKERMAGSLLVSSCHGEGLLKPLIPAPKYQISGY